MKRVKVKRESERVTHDATKTSPVYNMCSLLHALTVLIYDLLNYGRPVQHACGHGADVYIICETAETPNVDVRLTGRDKRTRYPLKGTVQLRSNGIVGEWGSICDHEWDEADARVICRMLGMEDGVAQAYRSAHFGQAEGPIYLDNVRCNGSESSIYLCDRRSYWGLVYRIRLDKFATFCIML